MAEIEHWWDIADWWTDPRLAYARGLVDGYAAGRSDRDAESDAVHRNAQMAGHMVARIEARAEADRPGPRPGDFAGGLPRPPEYPPSGQSDRPVGG